MSTNRIRVVVAYDGTDFCGWAAQTGQRTVQGTLTETVRQISGERIEILGASRTDSGAHAKGQVFHFDTESNMPAEKWAQVLNKRLPLDIAAIESRQAEPRFHSRFWARDRHYRYRISTVPRDPLLSRFVYGHGRKLDVGVMQAAAAKLVGEHDFWSFSEELEPNTNSVRVLFKVEVRERGEEIWIDIVGMAFVRGMMRRISGALLEIGRGLRPLEDIDRLLDREPIHLPVVLPARGLTLMKVRYGRRAWPQQDELLDSKTE